MRPKHMGPILEVVCETCCGTGNQTPGGGRNNLKDTCTTCGGSGMMSPRTGELPRASFDPAKAEDTGASE